MKMTELAAKPKLIKVTLDNPSLVETYGEAVEFWTWDRQPMDVFMTLAANNGRDVKQMVDTLRKLILDENGVPVLVEDVMLPMDVLVEAMNRITEMLGK